MRFLAQIKNHINILLKWLIHFIGAIFFRPLVGNRDFLNFDRQKSHRILYVCLAYRGDLIINFPAIAAFKRHFPDSRLTCWVRGYNESLARLNSDIDDVIVYDDFSNNPAMAIIDIFAGKRHSGIAERLREFDLYIDDSGYAFTAIMGFKARIPFRIGRNFQGFGFLNHYELAYNPNSQLIERRLKLLQPFGINLSLKDVSKPYFKIENEMINAAKREFGITSRDYFTVQAYAGWEAKNWGLDKYCRIAKRFAANSGLLPIFIGSDAEQPLINESLERCHLRAINIAGAATLDKAAAIIAGERLHFGSDSIGMQLAISLGVKSLTIFGPVNPLLCSYLGSGNIGVIKRTRCMPKANKIYCCFDAGRNCPYISWMNELREEDVFRVLMDLWSGKELPPVIEF